MTGQPFLTLLAFVAFVRPLCPLWFDRYSQYAKHIALPVPASDR